MGFAYCKVTEDKGDRCDVQISGPQGKESLDVAKSEIRFFGGRTFLVVQKIGGKQNKLDRYINVKLPNDKTMYVHSLYYRE